MPVTERRYKLPEKITVPNTKSHPGGVDQAARPARRCPRDAEQSQSVYEVIANTCFEDPQHVWTDAPCEAVCAERTQ